MARKSATLTPAELQAFIEAHQQREGGAAALLRARLDRALTRRARTLH